MRQSCFWGLPLLALAVSGCTDPGEGGGAQPADADGPAEADGHDPGRPGPQEWTAPDIADPTPPEPPAPAAAPQFEDWSCPDGWRSETIGEGASWQHDVCAPPDGGPAKPSSDDAECPAGWRRDDDGRHPDAPPNLCQPVGRLRRPCEGAARQPLGSRDCAPLGRECPPDGAPFPQEAELIAAADLDGISGPIVYVRAGRTDVNDAVKSLPETGGIVALSVGEHLGPIHIDRPVALVGACADGTVLVGPRADLVREPALSIRRAGRTLVQGLTVDSTGHGVDVVAGDLSVFRDVLIRRSRIGAIGAFDGAKVELREVVISEVGPDDGGDWGVALYAQGASKITGSAMEIRDAQFGLLAETDGRIDLSDSHLEDIERNAGLIRSGGAIDLDEILVERVRGQGMNFTAPCAGALKSVRLTDVGGSGVVVVPGESGIVELSLSDVVVSAAGSVGISCGGGCQVEGRGIVVDQAVGVGMVFSAANGRTVSADLSDVWIGGVRSGPREGQPGWGLAVNEGADVRARGLRIHDVDDHAVAAATYLGGSEPTAVELSDLHVSSFGHLPLEKRSIGVWFGPRTRGSVQRALIERGRGIGLAVLDAGELGGVEIEDLRVEDIDSPDEGAISAIEVAGQSTAEFRRIVLQGVFGNGMTLHAPTGSDGPTVRVSEALLRDIDGESEPGRWVRQGIFADGTALTLARAVLLNTADAGVRVSGGRVRVTDIVIQKIDGQPKVVAGIQGTSDLEVRRALLTDLNGRGLILSSAPEGAENLVEDLTVRNASRGGVAVIDDGVATLRRVAVERSGYGVHVFSLEPGTSPTATIDDLSFSTSTAPYSDRAEVHSFGIGLTHAGRLTASRIRVEGAENAVAIDGRPAAEFSAHAELHDVDVLGSTAPAGEGSQTGLRLSGAAEAQVDRLRVVGLDGTAVAIVASGSNRVPALQLQNLDARRLTGGTRGRHGMGVLIAGGRVDLQRAAIEDAARGGLVVVDASSRERRRPSVLTATELRVTGTRLADCAGWPDSDRACPLLSGGHGLTVTAGAQLSVRRFDVVSSEGAGLAVTEFGELTAMDGRLAENLIGLSFAEELNVTRVLTNVRFEDNAKDIDAAKLVPPSAEELLQGLDKGLATAGGAVE